MIFIEHLLCTRHSAKSSSTSLGRKGAGAQRTEEDCLTTALFPHNPPHRAVMVRTRMKRKAGMSELVASTQ